MATAKEIFDDAVDTVIQQIGQLATYTPRVGAPVADCSVDLVIESDEQPSGFDSTVLERETTIEYLLSEVGAEADPGDKFTVDSVVYTVKELRENDGRSVKVVVKHEG